MSEWGSDCCVSDLGEYDKVREEILKKTSIELVGYSLQLPPNTVSFD